MAESSSSVQRRQGAHGGNEFEWYHIIVIIIAIVFIIIVTNIIKRDRILALECSSHAQPPMSPLVPRIMVRTSGQAAGTFSAAVTTAVGGEVVRREETVALRRHDAVAGAEEAAVGVEVEDGVAGGGGTEEWSALVGGDEGPAVGRGFLIIIG